MHMPVWLIIYVANDNDKNNNIANDSNIDNSKNESLALATDNNDTDDYDDVKVTMMTKILITLMMLMITTIMTMMVAPKMVMMIIMEKVMMPIATLLSRKIEQEEQQHHSNNNSSKSPGSGG
jgi:uncharacterized membrane protein